MSYPLKKLGMFFLVFGVLTLLFMRTPIAGGTEVYTQEKTLSFLKDVIQLDLAKYNVNFEGYRTVNISGCSGKQFYMSDPGGHLEETILYNFKSDSNRLVGHLTVGNNTLVDCMLYAEEGEMLYNQSRAELFNLAKGVLQRYQQWLNDSSLTNMQHLLDLANSTENTTVTLGNIKLTITQGASTSFCWQYTYNNVDYTQLQIYFYPRGAGVYFWDDRSLYKIGNTEINISKEQALNIAKEYLKSHTYMLDSKARTLNGFSISDEKTEIILEKGFKEPSTFYPCWTIQLFFTDTLPDDVYSVRVGVWAGTGEVFHFKPMKTFRDLSMSTVQFEEYQIAIAIIITLIIVSIAIVKKIHKKQITR